MKIDGLNNSVNSSFSIRISQAQYKVGDVVDGTIDKIIDKFISVNMGNTLGKIQVAKNEKNQDMLVGDKISFKIDDISKEKISMSQICEEAVQELDIDAADLTSKDVYNNIDVMKKIAEKNDDRSKEYSEASTDDDILGRLNNNAVEEKIEEILNHEDILVNDLSVEKFMNVVVSNVESNENFTYDDNMTTKDILMSLSLPITDENIKYIEDIISKLSIIDDFTQDAMMSMIKNDMPITLNNVYKAVYNNKNINQKLSHTLENINDIEHEIDKILELQNIEVNEKNKDATKKLIENNTEVNEKNIRKYIELEKLNKNIQLENVMRNAVINIANGNVQDLYIGSEENLTYEVEQIQESLDIILTNVDALRDVTKNGKASNLISIDQIRKYIDENNISKNIDLTNSNAMNDLNFNEQLAETRENIDMIRLTLTVSSMSKMYDKGIDINLVSLKDAAGSLREIASNEITKDSTKLFVKTYEDINILKERDFRIYTDIEGVDSLNYLADKNTKAIEVYESNMTKSNYKFASEIKIADRNIDEILSMNDIEINDINRKSALALSLNDIDITIENVTNIAKIEKNLSYVIEKLRPEITLSMIDEGYDPTLMSLDDIVSYIDSYNSKNISKNENKEIIDELSDLLNNNNINSSQKEALIGIYRVINKITSTKEVGAGGIRKYDDISLTDIYNATKTLERENDNEASIDINIDDKFGMLERVINGDGNALNTIRASLSILRNNKISNTERAKSILEDINYAEKHKEVLEDIYTDIKNITVSEIENYKKFESNKSNMKDAIEVLIGLDDSSELKDSIKKIGKDFNDAAYDAMLEDVKNYKEKIKQNYKDILNNETNFENIDMSIDAIQSISNMISFTDKNENAFQVPMYINDELTNVNVYFKEGQNKIGNTKIDITVNLYSIGEVLCNIEVNDNKKLVSANLNVEENSINIIRDSITDIEDVFKTYGYENINIKVNGYRVNTGTSNKVVNIKGTNSKFEKII